MKRKILSIIIPVFNEERYIKLLFEKIKKIKLKSFDKEIIIVNDGSTDDSKKIIEKIVQKNKNIKVINKKNQGKGSAIKIGILKSKGNIVLIQDADLEYDPENYFNLLKPITDGKADAVIGSRFISNLPQRKMYFLNYLANIFLTFLSNVLTGFNLTDIESGFKVFNGNLIRNLAKNFKSNDFSIEPEIIACLTKIKNIRVYEIGISYYGRTYKEGKKISWRDFNYF